MFGWLQLLVAPVSSWLQARAEQKKIEHEGMIRLAEAKSAAQVAMATREITNEGDYDTAAMNQMQYSWKDEYLVIVLTAPFIGSFLPNVQEHVSRGWTYVAQAPDWYQWSFIGIICATFGLRWYARKTSIAK